MDSNLLLPAFSIRSRIAPVGLKITWKGGKEQSPVSSIRRTGTLVIVPPIQGNGMNTSQRRLHAARAESVEVAEDSPTANLVDGRTMSVPITWYPRPAHGAKAERANWRLIGRGAGIPWPDLDEDIGIEGLPPGRHPGGSQSSFQLLLPCVHAHIITRTNSRQSPFLPDFPGQAAMPGTKQA
jgi:hypothetical protein